MTGLLHVCVSGLEHTLRCPCCCTSASTLACLSASTGMVQLPMLKPGRGGGGLEPRNPFLSVIFAKLEMDVAER